VKAISIERLFAAARSDLETPNYQIDPETTFYPVFYPAYLIANIGRVAPRLLTSRIGYNYLRATAQAHATSANDRFRSYSMKCRLISITSMFKENEQFKQTRGLIELVSRLLKSVWARDVNDVFLIDPQHFDLSIADVRDKLTEISGMRDAIAKDLWDIQQSAHAQAIDLQTGKESATQLGALLLVNVCCSAVTSAG
jgi:hypothetical protein